MTRVLVLGAGGMLGHKVFQRFAPRFETIGTVREDLPALRELAAGTPARVITGVDVEDFSSIARLLADVRPDVIVNCAGMIKQRPEGSDEARSMKINAEFPHVLARSAEGIGARVVHLSTDCVFSGERGHYSEEDRPDPVDVYGESKLLGELDAPNAITLRTSMIGRELRGFRSLLEWFLRQPAGSVVRGFAGAIFSGLTNITVADEIARLIDDHPSLTGVYHLSAAPISKYELLTLVRDALDVPVRIEASYDLRCDRSLVSERYRALTGFNPQSWPRMVNDLAGDPTPYDRLVAL